MTESKERASHLLVWAVVPVLVATAVALFYLLPVVRCPLCGPPSGVAWSECWACSGAGRIARFKKSQLEKRLDENPWLYTLWKGGPQSLGAYRLGNYTPAQTDEAVPELIRAIHHPRGDICDRAVRLLAHVGPPGEAAIPVLIQALRTPTSQARNGIAWTLGAIRARPEVTVPALAEALGDHDEWVRVCAGFALRDFGPEARMAVPSLTRALEDPKEKVRQAAVCALGEIGRDALPALPALRKISMDPADGVHVEAMQAVTRISEKRSDLPH